MKRALAGALGAAGLVLVGAAVLLASRGGSEPAPTTSTSSVDEQAAVDRPNVLVIVWDTARADRMSLYGHDRPTTPRLERFASEALVFDQAHSPGIWTLPSHAAMFTGMPPESTGADERWLWLDQHHVTMAEHFGAHGYATFAFAANALLCGETNLVQGFDVRMNTYRGKVAGAAKKLTRSKLLPDDRSQELSPHWTPPEHGATNAEWGRAVYKDAAPLVGRTLVRWIEQRPEPDRPFFAYLNLMEAHTPRLPSREARERVIADPELIARGLETDQGHINLHFYNFGVHDYSEEELEAIRAVYDATLYDLDQATGELFEALERKGWLDDTIVVLTSDHGENLGDHGLFNHRFSLHETLTHVPLLVRWPEGLEPGREERPVSTIDLFPTLARLAGLPVPEHLDGDLLAAPRPAVSHLALPLEREIETVREVFPHVEVGPWMREGHALVEGRDKLVRLSDGTVDLFDLAADPGEARDLAEEAPQRVQALGEALDAWVEAVPPYDPDQRTEADDPVHVRANQEELRAALEALGYIQDEE